MKSVILLTEAADDLELAYNFYEWQEAGAGDYFKVSLRQDVGRLSTLHGIHPVQYGFFKVKATKFPYGIYYRDDHPDCVRVAAILDLRRNPAWIKKQLQTRNGHKS